MVLFWPLHNSIWHDVDWTKCFERNLDCTQCHIHQFLTLFSNTHQIIRTLKSNTLSYLFHNYNIQENYSLVLKSWGKRLVWYFTLTWGHQFEYRLRIRRCRIIVLAFMGKIYHYYGLKPFYCDLQSLSWSLAFLFGLSYLGLLCLQFNMDSVTHKNLSERDKNVNFCCVSFETTSSLIFKTRWVCDSWQKSWETPTLSNRN